MHFAQNGPSAKDGSGAKVEQISGPGLGELCVPFLAVLLDATSCVQVARDVTDFLALGIPNAICPKIQFEMNEMISRVEQFRRGGCGCQISQPWLESREKS